MNVARYLEESAERHPGQAAVVEGDRLISYDQWRLRSAKLAKVLEELGVERGDRVSLLLPNSTAFLEALFAAVTVGAVVVPIGTRLHPEEYAYLISHNESSVLIHDARYADGVASIDLPPSLVRLQVGGVAAAETLDYAAAVEGAADFGPAVERSADDVAALFYTSGTTGRPKAAMVTHGNLDVMVRGYLEDVYPASTDDRALHAGPLTHGSGLWSFALTAAAATHVLPQSASFNPEEIFGLVKEHRVTNLVFLSPTMVHMLIDSPASASADCSSLRFVAYGGAPMHPEDLLAAMDRWGPILCNIYGQVECPMTITALLPSEHEEARRERPERLRSAGRARPGIEVIVGDDDSRPLPTGVVGHVCVRGPIVMSGYWANPDATAEVFQTGWYRTGDLGRFDEDGFLFLVDRAKDVVISGGSNIYPSEVEDVISRLDAVREVAVVGVPDRFWGESVVAVVVPEPGCELTADEVIDSCRARLASYKKPSRVVFRSELPRSATGKVLKKELVAYITQARGAT
jgi:acyl-CoA synthetase (AMP-forming)/AMP-acid ligase II